MGKLHIEAAKRKERLSLFLDIGISEIQYLSTCNRVELMIVDDVPFNESRLSEVFSTLNPQWNDTEIRWALDNSAAYIGLDAIMHLFRTASSLDSLVIGEREIITQVRKSYDECHKWGLTGDYLRLIMSKTIECAKEVYTHTNIAKNPVSIVSLAYRTLRDLNLKNDSRVLVVGAGETNTTMCKFLFKHGFKNFTVINRTLSKAQSLADQVKGKALALSDLHTHKDGFDLLVTCTGSEDPIFTKSVYDKLLIGETTKKTIVDIAVPTDVDASIVTEYAVNYIEINQLKGISNKNLEARKQEISKCESYISNKLEEFKQHYKERKVEIAMKRVPQQIKEIRTLAVSEVFSKELETLDESSRKVLDDMLAYMEKKYISVPMKMAKEILLKNS
ncbi:MAG: glutamyl-tRNA reductase [Saprospiraceae bacterium]|jgi:glutamyl-tRNA reductase